MAVLENSSSGQRVMLLGEHLFGRQAGEPNTILSNPNVSRLHAWLVWGGAGWFLQDSSTNGTFVNGTRVDSGKKIALNENDRISFGGKNNDCWVLLNIEAPKTMLSAITCGLSDIPLDGMVALPSETNPEITIYLAPEGQWVCESQSGTRCLSNGDRVGTKDSIWRFVEVVPAMETLIMRDEENKPVVNVQTIFNVSQDEEHVSLKMIVNEHEVDLKQRTHHYLMLILARKRLKDVNEGLQAEEQGWLHKRDLDQLTGLTERHVNIQVYRFRKQIIKSLPSYLDLPQIIETRRGSIRFASEFIKISGGLGEALAC